MAKSNKIYMDKCDEQDKIIETIIVPNIKNIKNMANQTSESLQEQEKLIDNLKINVSDTKDSADDTINKTKYTMEKVGDFKFLCFIVICLIALIILVISFFL